jgi:hypothetical protein
LGARSIPLRDELKTHLGSYDAGGRHRYVAVHCRAHQDRDDSKVAGILGVEATRLGPEELCAVFDMRYGLVNPFLLDGRTDVIQLFDCGVLSEYSPPHTMMTNAGDLLWGVEFRSAELVAYLSNARVEDVAVPPGGRG